MLLNLLREIFSKYKAQIFSHRKTNAVMQDYDNNRQKNVVIVMPSDYLATGYLRTYWPFNYIQSKYCLDKKYSFLFTQNYISQDDILRQVKTIWFQRHRSSNHLKAISKYRELQPQYGYKLILDHDDLIWGKNEKQGGTPSQGIPSYNFSYESSQDSFQSSIDIMNMMDACVFSTPYLANYAVEKLKITAKVTVLPNTIPRYLASNHRMISEKIDRPLFVYTGSPTHYSNKNKLLGDWAGNWKDYLIQQVKDGSADLVCMGGMPWFFEPIKNQITIYEWLNIFDYYTVLGQLEPHFGVMPIVPNDFNRAKSNLKFLEYAASGIVAIGSSLGQDEGPYDNLPLSLPWDASTETIHQTVLNICEPDVYNHHLDLQSKFLIDHHCFTEDTVNAEAISNLLGL